MKRRENNQKVITLYFEMKDMMEILVKCVSLPFTSVVVVQLIFMCRSLQTIKRVGADGRTIKDRLEILVKETEDAINKCGTACDTYSRKNIIGQ
jgi:hypothetical protein